MTNFDEILPSYAELPQASRGGRSGWGLFGSQDSVGLLNLQTPRSIVSASRLVRRGAVFRLDLPANGVDPPLFGRGQPRHTLFGGEKGMGFDDVVDNFYPQGSSQWDALGHAAYEPDVFYNGATSGEIRAGQRNTIDHWARRGIVGRALVLDLEALLTTRDREFSAFTACSVSVDDLEEARKRSGVVYQAGDVLTINTGFLRQYASLDQSERSGLAETGLQAVGLEHSEDMAHYLWDAHVAALVSDSPAVEVWPPDFRAEAYPFGYLHTVLIGQFGLALGELWWLADLVDDCRLDSCYEAFLVSAPLYLVGGVGSPACALAIK